MADRNPRVLVTLDEETFELLQSLKERTGLSPSAVINRALGSQVADLWQYDTWLRDIEQQGRPILKRLAVDLLMNFGPDTLTAGIKALDPTYQTVEDRLLLGMASA